MSKLIVENRSDLSDADALRRVLSVVEGGKISANSTQHCYLTTWNDKTAVSTFLNKKSERFVVWDIPE